MLDLYGFNSIGDRGAWLDRFPPPFVDRLQKVRRHSLAGAIDAMYTAIATASASPGPGPPDGHIIYRLTLLPGRCFFHPARHQPCTSSAGRGRSLAQPDSVRHFGSCRPRAFPRVEVNVARLFDRCRRSMLPCRGLKHLKRGRKIPCQLKLSGIRRDHNFSAAAVAAAILKVEPGNTGPGCAVVQTPEGRRGSAPPRSHGRYPTRTRWGRRAAGEGSTSAAAGRHHPGTVVAERLEAS